MRIDLAGGTVEVGEWPGSAALEPIVLLHQGLGSVGLWRDFPRELAERTGRRVVAFSRFGHGTSSPPPRPRTPAFFHEEALEVLPELLERLGIERPVLLGHSDGASIGLVYAASHRVTALVLIAPHVFVEDVTVRSIRETRAAYMDGDLRERMARHHRDVDAAFWGWCDVWLDPAFTRWHLFDEAAALSAPVLLVQGSADPYGTLAQLEEIAGRARGPVQRLVVTGGHSPHLEHPDAVSDTVARFLAR
jgi:pimeloyl-ACP methyl ester carboxylesterase